MNRPSVCPDPGTPRWGDKTLDDLLAEVRRQILHIIIDDQGHGAVTVRLQGPCADVKTGSTVRFGAH